MPAPPAKIITSCHQPRFWSAVPGWVRTIRRFDDLPIDIVALDDLSFNDPAAGVATIPMHHPARKLVYGAVDSVRLAYLIGQLEAGTACFQIDIDVLLKQSIRPVMDLPHDFLISRAYGFPRDAVQKLGFVGCCGFFLAKPSSLQFCQEILHRLETKADGSTLDQFVLNRMLMEAADQSEAATSAHIIGGQNFEIADFTVAGCRIGVLPANAIMRNLNTDVAIFGNHCTDIIQMLIEL
jgi:hypothetical protein